MSPKPVVVSPPTTIELKLCRSLRRAKLSVEIIGMSVSVASESLSARRLSSMREPWDIINDSKENTDEQNPGLTAMQPAVFDGL